MKVVVVGSGAREHALAWALSTGADVVVSPGNDAIRAGGLRVTAEPAITLDADLFVIGPEQPLVDGLADELRAQGKLVVGPGARGAQLEGSKAFLKEFLFAAGVPTARYGVFDDEAEARDFLDTMTPPYVIKTDGLAGGKGVLVTSSLEEARRDVRDKLAGSSFGSAGLRVVIEEYLEGRECSMMVVTDGESAVSLAPARDYKRLCDGGGGPNTGGMGAYAPLDDVDDELVGRIDGEIIAPTLRELRRRGIEYRGVLYAGVMVTPSGPKLLEYNVRFGDPEAQVLSALYHENLLELLRRCATGELSEWKAPTRDSLRSAVTVVVAAEGYPDDPRAGDIISGLDDRGQLGDDVVVFHGGTRREGDHFVTSGGRVMSLTATGPTLEVARRRAYDALELVFFRGLVCRSDIASGEEAR